MFILTPIELPSIAAIATFFGEVVAVIVGILVFVRLWRTKVVRKFITTTMGIAEIQTSVMELMEKENELLKKERDDFKAKWEKAEADFDKLVDADEREMAGLFREIDARRVVNDQDKRVIDAYVIEHGDGIKNKILEEEQHVTRPSDRAQERDRFATTSGATALRRRERGGKARSSENIDTNVRDR